MDSLRNGKYPYKCYEKISGFAVDSYGEKECSELKNIVDNIRNKAYDNMDDITCETKEIQDLNGVRVKFILQSRGSWKTTEQEYKLYFEK